LANHLTEEKADSIKLFAHWKTKNRGNLNYRILLAKKFLLVFEDGICVIKHWLIHNTIRKDRYEETVYKDQKILLNIKENKAYSFGLPHGNQMATTCTHSIEENSTVQNRIE